MNVLAVDTSTESMGIALAVGEGRISLRAERGLGHAAALMPWIDRILADAGLSCAALDLLVCAVGPGSFTGIRIGIATVKGLSLASGHPAVGVCTLDALAWPLRFHGGAVIPVIDARKGRFYAAVFHGAVPAGAARDMAPADLREVVESERDPVLVGPDAERVRERIGTGSPAADLHDPAALLHLGMEKYKKEGAHPEGLTPIYLRRSEAESAAGRI